MVYMDYPKAVFVRLQFFLVLFCNACSCSSCYIGNKNNDHDISTDEVSDSDGPGTDSRDATDVPVEPAVDGPTDTASDPGPWEWDDLPPGEDCGPSCRQLTFSDGIKPHEWDVWDTILVYINTGWTKVNVVDIGTSRQVQLPSIHPEFSPPPPPIRDVCAYPAVFQGNIYYSWFTDLSSPPRMEIVHANIESMEMQSIWTREATGAVDVMAYNLDAYQDRLVSQGGCGSYDYSNLCYYALPGPCEAQVLIEDNYGTANKIWGDTAVWFSISPENIVGYDFSSEEFIDITDNTESQLNPQIHNNRVVYQDLQFGTSSGTGDWNHSTVFMYDLESRERRQITSSDWIAAYPDIFGDTIVWADYRACSNPNNKNDIFDVQVWGYNLSTSREFLIADFPGRSMTTPRIWGDRIFIHMNKSEPTGNAIYMFDLPD